MLGIRIKKVKEVKVKEITLRRSITESAALKE